MLDLNPQYIKDNDGKDLFVVISFDDFNAIRKVLGDKLVIEETVLINADKN